MMTTPAVISENIKPLASSVVKDIEDVVRDAELPRAGQEERPLLYFTSPSPGVCYYSFYTTGPAR